MDSGTHDAVAESVEYISARTRYSPTVGLVLGSGLSSLADRVDDPDIIPYQSIPHFPRSSVPGHVGRLVLGRLAGSSVCLMQGRTHYYEGYSAAEITLPIRAMQLMGVKTLIVTNAAGGIRHDLRPGDLMAIIDHINLLGLAGHNPLRGPNDEAWGPRFPDMSPAYDIGLLRALRAEAQAQGIPLQEGVYAMVAGPSFETPAEIRFLRCIGADVVGMSTVPEVIVARHGGMRVLGISLISNATTDSLEEHLQEETLHEKVLEAGQRTAPTLARLLTGVLGRLCP